MKMNVYLRDKFHLIAVLCLLVGGISILVGSRFENRLALNWRTLEDVNDPDARHENSYVEVNGKFYLVGGRGTRRIERYNPADSSWTQGVHTPGQISLHHFQAVAVDDTIYVLGAYTDTFPDENTVPNIYKYNTVSQQWVTGPSIPSEHQRGSTGAAVRNGKIYVVCGSIGGHGSSATRLKDFAEYDPVTDTWTTLPDAPHARDHANVAIVGNKLYVVGGRNGSNGDNVEEVDIYDFSTGQWSTLPPSGDIPTPRAGAGTVAVGSHVVVIGGESTQQNAHDEVEALNAASNTWLSLDRLVDGRHGTQAVYYDEKIYIASGAGEKGGGPELATHEILEINGEPLPVELAPGFSAVANGGVVLLSWRTLSETNNAGFEIQLASENGFEAVGFVEGMGTHTEPKDYRFTTEVLPPGRHVFRLKQIDFDGSFEYSPEVSAVVSVDGGYHLGAVYPNPLNPEARFTLAVSRDQHVRLEIFDILGRSVAVLHDGTLPALDAHTFEIHGASWAGGKYMLHAKGEYFTATRSLTVLK